MKIVYITHGTFNSAGMERTLVIKANYLADKLGHEVVIITTDQRGRPSYYQLSDKIKCIDISINFDAYYHQTMLKRIFSFLGKQSQCKRRLNVLLQELQADVVISLMSRILSFLPKIKDGSRKVFEYHFSRNVREQLFGSPQIGLFEKLIYRTRAKTEYRHIQKLDAFVVLTHEDALLWGDLKNLTVIPNASSFYPESQAALDNKIVITVGRLEPQKGYDYLVDVWKPVAEQHPDWKLEVYGDGKDYELIYNQITEANLQDSILIKKPTSEIEKKLLNSSIYLMTSRFEGFPMVLVEAMACGLPVVSFRCPCGPQDIINDEEDGFLIAIGDYQSMSSSLLKLIENENLRKKMGHAARVNIKRFSQDEVMSQWENLFNKLTAKK